MLFAFASREPPDSIPRYEIRPEHRYVFFYANANSVSAYWLRASGHNDHASAADTYP